jgi:hypothetical protein
MKSGCNENPTRITENIPAELATLDIGNISHRPQINTHLHKSDL